MKLSFLKKKANSTSFSETEQVNLKQQLTLKFEKILPLASASVRIHFTFMAANEAAAETLINQLKEMGNEIRYPMANMCCQIIGRSEYMKAEEQLLKQHLFTIAETASSINCSLENWRIEDHSDIKWRGGLVIKQQG